MRSVSVRLADLDKVKLNLGFVGENEHTHILFDCKKAFEQYPNAVPSMVVVPPKGDSYPAVVTREGDIVEWIVTDSDLIHHGDGEIQLQFKQGDVIMLSCKTRTSVAPSCYPKGTIPTPIQNWIAQANAILAEIPDDINSALSAAKASGEFDGDDGVGIASIAKTGTSGLVDTYTITLTDGNHYDIDVTNGTPGQNGVGIQNIAKTSTVGLVDTYTITLTNGDSYPFTVTNGQNGVEIDDTTPAVNKVFSSSKVDQELTDVKNDIQEIQGEINGTTTYEDVTWTGTLEAGRYDKNGNYTATNDYRSATVNLADVVSMKVTATDAAGTDYALVVYEKDNGDVVGTAFDCTGTRKTYTEQLVDNFPATATKAIIVHYRGSFDNPTIVLRKAVSTGGINADVEALETAVASNTSNIGTINNLKTTDKTSLVGAVNEICTDLDGGTTYETETWSGELEKGRYASNGTYSATNDYRSATVDLDGVVQLKVTATDSAGIGNSLVIYENNAGTVVGTAFDCDGTRKTYTNQIVENFPSGATKAIIVHYRGTFDEPIIVMTKQVVDVGIKGDVNILMNIANLAGKKIVCFGDSIFGIHEAPNDIPTYLAKYTGAICYNIGFSGAWMADRQSQTGYNAFSLNHIIDSVVAESYTEQETAFSITPTLPSQYRTNLTTLEGIDFDDVDIVTISFGTNDFMSAIPYENQNDDHDVTTVFGSLRHCVEALLTKFPNVRIFICGQAYRFWMDGSGNFDYDSNTYKRSDNTTLIDMVDLTKGVAEEYNLPFIDNYIPLGINQYNCFQYFPENDGTHHNLNGVKLIARHIAHELF